MAIPLVDLIMTSTTSVMMVKMAEDSADRRLALSLFHETVGRLAFLLMPVGIGLSVLAHPFIVALFTDKFQAGVPIFSVWALTVLPAIVAVDAVLRAYAQTRWLLAMNLIRLAFVISLIGWFLGVFGLVGAVLVTLLATVAAKAFALVRVATLLQVSLARVLPWAALARLALRAVVAAVPAWATAAAFTSVPALAFASGTSVYGLTYLALCYAPGLAEPAAIRLPIASRGADLVRSARASLLKLAPQGSK
jgi:O-antigen/teichoic acid export membrane protein